MGQNNSDSSLEPHVDGEKADPSVCNTPNESWNPSDPTDGKTLYQCGSSYARSIRYQIWAEAAYICLILFLCIYLVLWLVSQSLPLAFIGFKAEQLPVHSVSPVAFLISGLLGGAMFDLKWLYRVVARGWWHQDRRVWRICSPWLSATLAMMIGISIDGGLLGLSFKTAAGKEPSLFLGVGFITGYFADSALAKLQEIAGVIFGTAQSPTDSHGGSSKPK
jgi:hypothetical protein